MNQVCGNNIKNSYQVSHFKWDLNQNDVLLLICILKQAENLQESCDISFTYLLFIF